MELCSPFDNNQTLQTNQTASSSRSGFQAMKSQSNNTVSKIKNLPTVNGILNKSSILYGSAYL